MKFKAEDGTEWEADPDQYGTKQLWIKRVPGRSELVKWASGLNCGASAIAGFEKAIEVAEEEIRKTRDIGGSWVLSALKKFAGQK